MKKTNPKKSKAIFTKQELQMIKDIKQAGYIVELSPNSAGGEILEPCKSVITNKTRLFSISYASTITEWSDGHYPLKDWHQKFAIKK